MATDHDHGDHDDHDRPAETVYGDGELYGVLAEFDTPGELVAAARKVREAGYTQFDCYTPFPVHGIDEAMGIKRTILPIVIFGGGFTGTIGGLLLQWYCNAYKWGWNISGKPVWSIPANIPIGFETTILLSVLTAFFGMWIMNKLPQVWHPYFRSERFARVTDDAFVLGIEASDERFDAQRTAQLLKDAGALDVESVYLETDPARKNMPRWITALIVASTAFALIPFAIAAKARNSHSSEPHIHIFPDMDFQPKHKPDTASDLFADGRANRGFVPGTVARGALNADDLFYRGLERTQTGEMKWTQSFPKQLDITPQLLQRGQQRFNIYCAPCHGYDGHGTGTVHFRAEALSKANPGSTSWVQPRDLVKPPDNLDKDEASMLTRPNGQLFNVISNGMQTMPGYAAQIPHADRWAIILYVRALQRAANAPADDVPAADRDQMMAPSGGGAAPTPAPAPAPAPGSASPPPAAGSAAGSGTGASK